MQIRARFTLAPEEVADAQLAIPAARFSYAFLATVAGSLAFLGLAGLRAPIELGLPLALVAGVAVYALRRPLQRRAAGRYLSSMHPDELQH